MAKPNSMSDRVLDLVASGITDSTRLYHILKAENWPEVATADPADFQEWLRGQGYTVDENTKQVTL